MIKNIMIAVGGFLVIFGLLLLMVYIFLKVDEKRCTSMEFSEMMQDESCSAYWEAIKE